MAAGGNVLLAPLYLRLLNPQDFGLWSKFMLMLQLAQVPMGWGLMAAVSRLIAEAEAPERQARLLGAAVTMATVLNGVLLVLTLALWAWPTQAPSRWPGADWALLLPAVLGAALLVYPAILLGKLVADGAAVRHRSLSLVGFALQLTILLAAAALGYRSAGGAVAAMVVALGCFAMFAAIQLRRAAAWHTERTDLRALLAFGLPIVVYTLAGQATDFAIRYCLSRQVTTAEFGAFSAGLIYASVVAMLCSAVNLAWMPLFYRHAHHWYAQGTYRAFVDLFIAATAGVAALMVVFAPELLALYAGGRVILSTSTAALLTIAAWLNSAVWMAVSNPLFEQKRTRTVLLLALAAALPSMALGFMLIRDHGGRGAAGALLANALLLATLARWVAGRLRLPGPSLVPSATALGLLLLVASPWCQQRMAALHGVTGVLYKLLAVLSIFAVLATITLRDGLKAFKTIESSHSR